MDTKQVLVVRKDLNMRKGKIAAQCAHASLKVLVDNISHKKDLKKGATEITIRLTAEMDAWLSGSFAKICVYVESEEELLRIYNNAKEAGLPASIITDAGRTEFHGIPTKTVIAIGPASIGKIDKITGHLPLL